MRRRSFVPPVLIEWHWLDEKIIQNTLICLCTRILSAWNNCHGDSLWIFHQTVSPQGLFDKAEKLYNCVIEIQKDALGDDNPELAKSFGNLAALLLDQVSNKYSRRSYCLLATSLGTIDIDSGNTPVQMVLKAVLHAVTPYNICKNVSRCFRGWVNSSCTFKQLTFLMDDTLSLQGRYYEADELYKRAVEVLERALGSNNQEVAAMLNMRARLLQAQVMPCIPLWGRRINANRKALKSMLWLRGQYLS